MNNNLMAVLKSKLAILDKERDRIMTTIDVLKELDSESLSPKVALQHTASNGTMIDAIISTLRSSGQMMTVSDIYNHVTRERKTSRAAVYTALSRLHKRGKVFKNNNLWKLMENDDEAEPGSKDYPRLISTEQ